MEQKFFRCRICKNFVGSIYDSGVPMICCGEEMKQMTPNTSDGAGEKHVPVVEVNGNKVTVTVGSVEHPMLPEHYIEWIYLQTENGGQRKKLKPGDKPQATFLLENDKPVAAFEFCNLHMLWEKKI